MTAYDRYPSPNPLTYTIMTKLRLKSQGVWTVGMTLANERIIQSVTKPCYTRARRVGIWTTAMRAEPKYWFTAKRYGWGWENGADIVNAQGPIRQVVRDDTGTDRHYLVIAAGTASHPGAIAQLSSR